jgi:hypothetical protein
MMMMFNHVPPRAIGGNLPLLHVSQFAEPVLSATLRFLPKDECVDHGAARISFGGVDSFLDRPMR